MTGQSVPCPECGARFEPADGPTHAYVGGSPACWASFGGLGVRETELGILGPDRLSVHVYMAQHPGVPGRRQAQSVGVHLMVLGTVLEDGLATGAAVSMMPRWLARKRAFPWLDPPSPRGGLTLLDAPEMADRTAHEVAVRAWADDVWANWSVHHASIRRWLITGGPD